MTVRTRQTLTAVAVVCGVTSVIAFVISWSGVDLPAWVRDARWILLLISAFLGTVVSLGHAILSTEESFRLGVVYGEYRHDTGREADLPKLMGGDYSYRTSGTTSQSLND